MNELERTIENIHDALCDIADTLSELLVEYRAAKGIRELDLECRCSTCEGTGAVDAGHVHRVGCQTCGGTGTRKEATT